MRSEFAEQTVATVHPSSLLRAPDPETRELEYAKFVDDLRVALKATK
jgi:DNA polymerase